MKKTASVNKKAESKGQRAESKGQRAEDAWQGRRREQVEFAATLFVASMAGLFLMAVVIAIIKIVN